MNWEGKNTQIPIIYLLLINITTAYDWLKVIWIAFNIELWQSNSVAATLTDFIQQVFEYNSWANNLELF
jgi:hypothetical protein